MPSDFEVELDSLVKAGTALDLNVIPRIDALSTHFQQFLQGLSDGEWTQEDAAWEYGRVYAQAIGAYDQVIQGIKADIHRYRKELDDTHTSYRTRDDAVMDEMNRRLAKLGETSSSDEMGRIAYGQRDELDTGSPLPSPRPDDTSPETKDDPA